MLIESYFSAWQEKLENEPEWLSLLNPATGMLWRNKAWRDFLDVPAFSPWAEASLLVASSDFRRVDDAVSRALKQGIITALVIPLRIPAWENNRFAISVGQLHYDDCALVMLHVLHL